MSTPFAFTPTQPFTPLSVSNCQLWLDASDPTTCLKSGSTVTAWNDKSGNGKNITITGTLTFSNATGNVGAANSVNTASGLTSYFTTAVDLRKSVTPNTSVFIVYAWLAAGSGSTAQTFWGNDAPNAANRVQFFDFSSVFSGNSYGYFLNNGYLYNPTQLNRSTTQMYELISQVGVTNGTGVYFNGALGSAGLGSELTNTSFSGNEILYFGGGETNSIYPSYTQFNEILVYSSALTQGERQQIEGYLAWKWGLVNLLPAQHPFKVTPPNATPNFQRLPFREIQSFSPLYIPGCMFWIDAQDPTTVTSNAFSVITQVRDKSGNGYNLTNNMTTFGFTYNYEAFFNGSYPSFYNQNGAQTYTLGSNSSFSLNQPATIFTVHQIVGGNSFQDLVDSTNATNRFFIYYFVPSISSYSLRLFAGSNVFSGGSLSTQGGVYSYLINSSTSFMLQNGANLGSGDAGTNTCTGITIGSRYTQNEESFVGHICEVICYSGSLTTAQRQRVEGYLAWKWGLQGSLPATHPYRNSSNNNPGPYGPVYPFGQRNWLPSQLSGLQLWLDAADRSSLTLSGSTVTAWRDRTGINTTFSITGSPALITSSLLGNKNAVRFNGSSDSLYYSAFTVSQPLTVFAVTVQRAASLAGYSFVVEPSIGSSAVILYRSGPALYYYAGTDVAAVPTVNYSSNITGIYSAIFNGASSFLGFNGSGTANQNPGTYAWTNLYLGRDWSGVWQDQDVAEVLFYNSALSTPQRQQVEGYLAWKWGLQGSLPATHPFKYFPPAPS